MKTLIKSVVTLLAFAAIAPAAIAQDKTIVEIAAGNPDFSTLVAAVKAADPAILKALSDKSAKLTVFAPTNDAFAKLLKKLDTTPEKLLADKKTLNAVLQYHVLASKVMAKDAMALKSGTSVQTLLKGKSGKIKVTHSKDGVTINDAKVIKADIEASNGVIHVIDTVLVPAAGKKK